MWTEAIILGLFALISTLVFKGKELYETWIKFRESWRHSDDAKESLTITELRQIITELRQENAMHKSALNFLGREQIRYIRAETELWGYLQWLHDYAGNLCHAMNENGMKAEPPPPMPKREQWTLSNVEDFQVRTRETQDRLQKEVVRGQTEPADGPTGEKP